MANKKKGKKKGGKRKSGKKKVSRKKPTRSVAFEAAGVYDMVKVGLADDFAAGTFKAIYDKTERANLLAYLSDGRAAKNVVANTKEMQIVVGERLLEALPGIGPVARKMRGKLNSAARPYTGKKYNLV